jgi:hypothetical protein
MITIYSESGVIFIVSSENPHTLFSIKHSMKFFFENGSLITIYSDEGRLQRMFFIPVILNMHANKRLFSSILSGTFVTFTFRSACLCSPLHVNQQYLW